MSKTVCINSMDGGKIRKRFLIRSMKILTGAFLCVAYFDFAWWSWAILSPSWWRRRVTNSKSWFFPPMQVAEHFVHSLHEDQFPSWCGKYDDISFISSQICCACGGGNGKNDFQKYLCKLICQCLKLYALINYLST